MKQIKERLLLRVGTWRISHNPLNYTEIWHVIEAHSHEEEKKHCTYLLITYTEEFSISCALDEDCVVFRRGITKNLCRFHRLIWRRTSGFMPVLLLKAALINIFILQWVKGQCNLKGVAHGGRELSPVCAGFDRLSLGLLLQPQLYVLVQSHQPCFHLFSARMFC